MIDFSKFKKPEAKEEKKEVKKPEKSWWDRTLEASKQQAQKEAMETADMTFAEKWAYYTGKTWEQFAKGLWEIWQEWVKSSEMITKAVATPILEIPRVIWNVGKFVWDISMQENLKKTWEEWQKKGAELTESWKNLFDFSESEKKASKASIDFAPYLVPWTWAVQSFKRLWVVKWIWYWAAVWAGTEVPQKILSEWRAPTASEVWESAVLWGAVYGWLATIPKIQKYSKAMIWWWLQWFWKSVKRDFWAIKFPWSQTVTRDVPKKIVSWDLWFTPTERAKIEKITGKDEATYILEKGLAWKWKEELAEIFMKQADDMYSGITNKLAKVDKRVKSNTAKEALLDIKEQLESSPKLARAYKKDIDGINEMLAREDFTLLELNNIRRAYDKVNTGMFTAQWKMRSWLENAIDVKVRQELSSQLQKEAKKLGIDVKAMNTELRAGLEMKDALLKRLSQEEKNNFIGLQDLWVSAILSGGNPVTAVWTIIAKKYVEKLAPKLSQKLYNLNKSKNVPRTVSRGNTITPSNKSSLLNLAGKSGDSMASKQVKNDAVKEKTIITKPQTNEPKLWTADKAVKAIESWLDNVSSFVDSVKNKKFTDKISVMNFINASKYVGIAPYQREDGSWGITLAPGWKTLAKAWKMAIFAGWKAQKAPPKNYTGWFKGADGKMRFEIDDSSYKIKHSKWLQNAQERLADYKKRDDESKFWLDESPDKYFKSIENAVKKEKEKMLDWVKLSQIIEHNELFKQYPNLANLEVYYYPNMPSWAKMFYNPKDWFWGSYIAVWDWFFGEKWKSDFLHEIQHSIQDIEWFAQWASFKDEWYNFFWWEVESRNVQKRMNMTMEERLKNSPESTEDVPRSKQIIRMDSKWPSMSVSDDLISEAKKYKSAEEFIKAQPKIYRWQKMWNDKLMMNNPQERSNMFWDAFFFADDKKLAEEYWKVIEVPYLKEDILSVNDVEKITSEANKKLEQLTKKWIYEWDEYEMLEALSIWKYPDIAKYTGKPFIRTWRYNDTETLYYPELDNTKTKLKKIWEQANKTIKK